MFFEISQSNARFIIKIFGFRLTFQKLVLNRLLDMCYIPDLEYLKKQGTGFMHPVNVVIDKGVKVGKNCLIHQNVTIGSENVSPPILGDRVTIYPNVVIWGNVKIGNDVIIGAGSVVKESVPDSAVVAGNPAKVIKYIDKQKI